MKILYSFNWLHLILGIFIAIVLIQIQTIRFENNKNLVLQNIEMTKKNAPSSNWLVLNNVLVPDFNIGDDPNIIVDREIKKPFLASWSVELQKIGSKNIQTVCYGSGENQYTKKDNLPENISLGWWMGGQPDTPPCILRLIKGNYRICTAYVIRPENYPNKQLKKCSSSFKINEKKLDNTE